MSRYADAAYAWLKENAPDRDVTSNELWHGLNQARPDLTTPGEHRKTPRTTLMRDLRKDPANRFVVGERKVRINRGSPER